MKSRTFSIYLLKEKYLPEDTLKDENPLGTPVQATNLPVGSKLYLLDLQPNKPWWKDYWGINKKIEQSSKGAMVFIPINKRFFVLTFGHTYHYLKEDSYEYDFGLRMTLNALDPKKLKSTDIFAPENSQRRRIQSPTESDLTFFDFDRDSSIIKRFTGKVKDEYKDIFSNTTGANNLSVSIKKQPQELPAFLSDVLAIYKKDDYKKTFSDIHNIIPLQDPIKIDKLNCELIKAFEKREKHLVLSIPDIIDYDANLNIYFSKAGHRLSAIYQDVYIDYYREYLSLNSKTDITIQDMQKHLMNLCDDDGNSYQCYSVFKSLLFDCSLDNNYYHLSEGNWYQIDNDYLEKLEKIIDPYFYTDNFLLEYNHSSEGEYNAKNSEVNTNLVCLDKNNISPKSQTSIEPCDLYFVENDKAVFYHIKLSTRSSTLSHLFNQGVNSAEILRTMPESKEKLKSLIEKKIDKSLKDKYIAPIDNGQLRIVYAIITHKDINGKSKNLPIFSKITLKHCINIFNMMNIDVKVCYIKDNSLKKPSKKRKTAKRKSTKRSEK
jgi:uncharacterized protein (TIGR04141 family)